MGTPLQIARSSMPASAREPLLEISDLAAGYGKIGVLNGINLTVGAGEVVALLGPHGAGGARARHRGAPRLHAAYGLRQSAAGWLWVGASTAHVASGGGARLLSRDRRQAQRRRGDAVGWPAADAGCRTGPGAPSAPLNAR